MRAPQTVDELTQRNIDTILQLETATRAERTKTERFAEVVTNFCGSMKFIWSHLAAMSFWMLWNSRELHGVRYFDPFPYNFMSCILCGEAIFLASFILMNQRHDSQLSERRNHLDLQINLLSEQENTKILQILSQIAKKVGAEIDRDPDLSVLQAAASPERMLKQIDETIAQNDENKQNEDANLYEK